MTEVLVLLSCNPKKINDSLGICMEIIVTKPENLSTELPED